ncbi:hypothetical protein RB195_004186 [Necator americanus]|uniref:Treslin STD domain-containing protein n=1 Tax=Necator americanus TaxID=51031 RepID=A0ABR1BIU0_NECAM
MGEVSSASFADVTFALIQKVSPRKIKRSDIPNEAFHALRKMVSNELSSIPSPHFVAALPSGAASNGNLPEDIVEPVRPNFGLFEDEDSRMSGCESSEGSQSQCSIEDEPQRLLAKSRVGGYSSSASSLSQLNSPPKSLKQSTRARRLTELRAARRKAAQTDETHMFCCSEEDLPVVFGQWYDGLLDAGEQPVKCYQLIVNSLKKFFVTNTFGNAVETMVSDFLRAHVIRSCAELNRQYEVSTTDSERRLRETQLQVLLEVHISHLDPKGPSRVPDIVRKMRIVYFVANASSMRTFLEEQVADNFVHLVPKLVAELFDELCIQLPHDLEEYDSVWNKDDDLSFPLFNQKGGNPTQQQQLDQLIEEVQAPEEEPVNGKIKGAKKKSDRGVEVNIQTAKDDESQSGKTTQRKSSRLHPPRTIPETPEEKLRERVKDEEVEVVKATPMAKVCGNPRRRHSRLSELVRISEERAKIPRAAAIASAKACKAIIQASQSVVPTSRDSLLGLHTPSPRPQRAKSNLLSRFSNTVNKESKDKEAEEVPMRVLRSSSTSHNTPPKRAADVKPSSSEPPEKKTRLSSSATSAPTSTPVNSPSTAGIDEILGKEQLSRFQRRVEEINNIKELDESEVYYEPLLRRTSLYDEEVVSLPNGKIQQNRTRRLITPSSAAHLAHTLLNVDNDTPLEVWKLPRNLPSPEKMPRMIRTGINAIKMKKIQRMREQCCSAPSPTGSRESERSTETE